MENNEIPHEEDIPLKGCWKCGGSLVEIRPKYPGGERRMVCPTCLADRIDMIVDIAKPNPPAAKE